MQNDVVLVKILNISSALVQTGMKRKVVEINLIVVGDKDCWEAVHTFHPSSSIYSNGGSKHKFTLQ